MVRKIIRQSEIPLSKNPELKEEGQSAVTLMNLLIKLSIQKAKVKNINHLNKIVIPSVEEKTRRKYIKLWFEEGKFSIIDGVLHSSICDSLDTNEYLQFEILYKNKASHSYCRSGNRENYYELLSLIKENQIHYYIYTLMNKTKYNIPLWWVNSRLSYKDYFIYKYLCSRKTSSKNDWRLAKKIFGIDIVQKALAKFKDVGLVITNEEGLREIIKPREAKKIISQGRKLTGFLITFNS